MIFLDDLIDKIFRCFVKYFMLVKSTCQTLWQVIHLTTEENHHFKLYLFF